MEILLGIIAVLSFGLTCFSLGYSAGKDSSNTKTQKFTRLKYIKDNYSLYIYDVNGGSVYKRSDILGGSVHDSLTGLFCCP